MEDINVIVSLVSSLGFPVVCCGFMWKYINSMMHDFNENIQENTKMLTRIYEKLDIMEEKEDS